MDELIRDIENRKNGEKFHDFVLDEAVFYINKAQEALEADPEEWYKNSQLSAQTFIKLFPQIYFTQQQLLHEASDTGSEQTPTHRLSSP